MAVVLYFFYLRVNYLEGFKNQENILIENLSIADLPFEWKDDEILDF